MIPNVNVNLCIVSHGHEDFILGNQGLIKLSQEKYINIYVKDNIKNNRLKFFCEENNIEYLVSKKKLGFGANNNFVFKEIYKQRKVSADDYFLVMNPDIIIDTKVLINFIHYVVSRKIAFSTMNVTEEKKGIINQYNIRKFPTLIDFIASFFSLKSYHYNKCLFSTPCEIDWGSGSFLMFNSLLYDKLDGFDEFFFMYCEDIDICKRAKDIGYSLVYIPYFKAFHNTRHENKRMFNKKFFFHISSIFYYLRKDYKLN